MATIVLKFEGRKGDFFNARRGFLVVRNPQRRKGKVLLRPGDCRSAAEVESTVRSLRKDLDAVVKAAKREFRP
jgi:hypothetical protein